MAGQGALTLTIPDSVLGAILDPDYTDEERAAARHELRKIVVVARREVSEEAAPKLDGPTPSDNAQFDNVPIDVQAARARGELYDNAQSDRVHPLQRAEDRKRGTRPERTG